MIDDELTVDSEYIENNVPILYKYMKFEDWNKIHSNFSLAFKHPSIFNDPYDCYPDLIKFDNVPSSYQIDLIQRRYPNLSISEIDKKIKRKVSTAEWSKLFKEEIFPDDYATYRVSCFSENFDNLLMWSHYGLSHTGVCIGFERNKLYNSFEFSPENITLLKVSYSDVLESVDYFKDPIKAFRNLFRIKSNLWSYEKEIRIIVVLSQTTLNKIEPVPFEKDSIKVIILGSKIG